MIYIFIIFSILFYILFKFKKCKNEYFKLIFKYLFIAFLTSTVLELTIFNFRHYESLMFNNKKELYNYTYNGITCENDKCNVIESSDAYIEISDINEDIKNIYIDFDINKNSKFSYDLYFTDEANKLYLYAGNRSYIDKIDNSKYIRVHTSGDVSKIKINILSNIKNFKINTISINTKVPLFINNIRLLIIFFFIFFILIINPKSILHNIKFNNKKLKIVTVIFVICLSLLSFRLTFYNKKTYSVSETSQYSQYKNLAHALSKGHFYLDLKVSDKLLELENPYDTKYRDSKLERYKEYYWDYAYYNGKYYSYFGIVPCILLYLPFYIITGIDLPNNVAIGLATMIFISSILYLIYQILNKYFKNTSYIWYMLLSIFVIFSSGISTFIGYPTFYNLPIIFAISFSLLALAFWIKSTTYQKLNKKYLLFGSTSMALVAGCRPQLLLIAFLSIVIFWDYVFKKRELFSKKSIKETLLFISPFIVVALFLMYYNYMRFNSPFDFGANYNLTTNDMTKRGFEFDRIFLGLYYFLLTPTRITPIFPFIEKYSITTTYLGNTIHEIMYGGFLFQNIICILGILSYKFKKIINSDLFKMSILFNMFALIIVVADTEMAGILPRYIGDFGFLISLSTVIVILSLLSKKILNNDFKKLIVIFITISIIYNALTFFLNKNLTGLDNFYYMFMFWL